MRKKRRRLSETGRVTLSPVDGGKTDKIHPVLQYQKPLSPPGSLSELFLLLKNKTGRRVEGWLTITPPPRWGIEPGKRLNASGWKGRMAEVLPSTPAPPARAPIFADYVMK